ncbi:MAG: CopG family transcriptional regulator [Candidatus Poribacteria bacterium]
MLKIHLQPEEAKAVRELAKSRGVSYADLIREWVLERIHIS